MSIFGVTVAYTFVQAGGGRVRPQASMLEGVPGSLVGVLRCEIVASQRFPIGGGTAKYSILRRS